VSTTEISPPTEAAPVVPEATTVVPADGTPPTPPKAAKAPKAKKVKVAGRTTRVILRRLDPWSVLKLSLVYYLAVFVVILVAATLLWAGAEAAGVVGNIEDFMIDIGFEDFQFLPSKLLGGVALGGLVLVVAGTFANVLLASLFNLMSDVVGGLKLTLQEDVAPASTKDDGAATV
jgi:hypothetical protein